MAPSNQRYEPLPPVPSYDEAVAGGSRPAFEAHHHSPTADAHDPHSQFESQLLLQPRPQDSQRRWTSHYRHPTVETDDESDEDDDGEAAEVRREMQEFEVLDVSDEHRSTRPSIFGKGIGLTILSLNWKWSWRWWRWPFSKLRVRLPDGNLEETGHNEPRRRCLWPSINLGTLVMVIGRLLAIVLVLGFLYLLFMSDLLSNMSRRIGGPMFDPESVRRHIQVTVDSDRMREHLKHFTQYANMAGTEGDYALAEDVKNIFERSGLEDVSVDEYYVYLNYPKAGGRAVQIMGDDDKPIWSAKIEEEEVGVETKGHQTLVFHGHSKSGDVRGPLIYANYGSREDFKRLYDSGIATEGAIALVRHSSLRRDAALKVKAAEMAGFAGCITYSDPADDGFLKGETAPNGPYMPADGVQRGTVSLTNWMVGDVLTPGWESKNNLPRVKPAKSPGLVQIPSIPLAWRDAQVLLQHLKGFGQRVPEEWQSDIPDIGAWWSGNLSSPVVRLKNEQDEAEQQPIWNVYGRIIGAEQAAKTIIIGNHRDAWSFGATSPHSGTAVQLELVRIFGELLGLGWRPLRTIEFMSWDAGEYNFIGSTEFVEKDLDSLRADALAYINLDNAVSGDSLRAYGSPVFKKQLMQILRRVADPNLNTTLHDLWERRNGELEGLGADSDYVAFQDIAGTSSLDLRFDGPATPYHSSYDNFDWMERVGDPGFVYHKLLGQVLGLLIIELADRPILPFDMTAYSISLERWVDELIAWTEHQGANQAGATPIDLNVLKFAANVVVASMRKFEQWELTWENSVLASNSWEPVGLGRERGEYNSRMAQFDTDLLDLEFGGGVSSLSPFQSNLSVSNPLVQIPNRTQFKHVVFGPQLWPGKDEAFFPAIRDAISSRNWTLANQTIEKTARILQKAAANLIT